MSKTEIAFRTFREGRSPRALLDDRVKNDGERAQMTEADGLRFWDDGPLSSVRPDTPATPPVILDSDLQRLELWVVTKENVPIADENCHFGTTLESRVIKHSNLTGGGTAYSGGELLRFENETIVINGRSGRYGPRSATEMDALARAFKDSGYHVWSMGYDPETDRPFSFIGIRPRMA